MVALAAVVARAQVRADRAERPQKFELKNAGLGPAFFVCAIADPAGSNNRRWVRMVQSINRITFAGRCGHFDRCILRSVGLPMPYSIRESIPLHGR